MSPWKRANDNRWRKFRLRPTPWPPRPPLLNNRYPIRPQPPGSLQLRPVPRSPFPQLVGSLRHHPFLVLWSSLLGSLRPRLTFRPLWSPLLSSHQPRPNSGPCRLCCLASFAVTRDFTRSRGPCTHGPCGRLPRWWTFIHALVDCITPIPPSTVRHRQMPPTPTWTCMCRSVKEGTVTSAMPSLFSKGPLAPTCHYAAYNRDMPIFVPPSPRLPRITRSSHLTWLVTSSP